MRLPRLGRPASPGSRRIPAIASWSSALLLAGGCAGAPTYLHSHGASNDSVVRLGWFLTITMSAIVLLIAVLLLGGVFRRRPAAPPAADVSSAGVPLDVARSGTGLRWITIGVGLTAIVLAVMLALSLVTLSAAAAPPRAPALVVEVTGHQWWWELRYGDAHGGPVFVTANELHVPVGQPVRIELRSTDVIHSFWVPELAGKTDVIPGQTNVSWIQADRPGRYVGPCTEYCGLQHAHMQLVVVAEDPASFRAWRMAQLRAAPAPPDPGSAAGQQVFASRCGACHAVRGTDALGRMGPDLTHLMSRRTIAAGLLPNTRGYRAGWIVDPQRLKPGTMMPAVDLDSGELQALLAYLETLD